MPPIRHGKQTQAELEEERQRMLAERAASKISPWPITHESHPCIRAGQDQCMTCGKFGHRRPCLDPERFKIQALEFQYWRYVSDGRLYSSDKLRMAPAELEAVDPIEAPLMLSAEDVEILDAIEKGNVPQEAVLVGVSKTSQELAHNEKDEMMDLDVAYVTDTVAKHEFSSGRSLRNVSNSRIWALHGNHGGKAPILSGWQKY